MKKATLITLLFNFALAGTAFGQQRLFNWVRADKQLLPLDPGYHQAQAYDADAQGLAIHLDLQAQQPVTIAVAERSEWEEALQHPAYMSNLRFWCVREHVTQETYSCNLPPSDVAMVLVIRDERDMTRAVPAGIESALKAGNSTLVKPPSPNKVQITYYRWDCVENCPVSEISSGKLRAKDLPPSN